MNLNNPEQQCWFTHQMCSNQLVDSYSYGSGGAIAPTNTPFINLDNVGRQTLLEQCFNYSFTDGKGVLYTNRQNAIKDGPNQELLSCVGEYTKHNDVQSTVRKRLRVTFTPSQLERLESEFRVNMYVVGIKRSRLAEELNLEERHVKIWFQNRRMKLKRDQRLNHRQSLNNLAMQNQCCWY